VGSAYAAVPTEPEFLREAIVRVVCLPSPGAAPRRLALAPLVLAVSFEALAVLPISTP
jgi:hypothetical protein